MKYLLTLESNFERYFPEITNNKLGLVRNFFTFFVKNLSDECQNKFLELVNDFSARQAYHEKFLTQFLIKIKDSYSKTTKKALCILIPYMSTYLCEARFSALLQIKTKKRNKLDVKEHLRCALSQTIPCILQLSYDKQTQVSN